MLICGSDKSLPCVPRSKGCITCVSRKTRCDRRRPTCRACENRKQSCGGYRRQEVVFLSEGWRALGVGSVPCSKKKDPHSFNQSAILSPDSRTLPRSETGTDLVLYPNLVLDRSDLHVAFFLASFGTRPSQTLAPLGNLFRHYLSLISSTVLDAHECSSSPSTPVVFAVDALAHSHFGTANADSVSVHRSFRSYGMALQSMSRRLAKIKRADSDLHKISEEDWQHLAFFCIVMAFWEMKMSPASCNWHNHIRCLASAISLRGTDHMYSKTNSQVLVSSRLLIFLHALSARQPNDRQQRSPMHSAWLKEIRLSLGETKNLNSSTDCELYRLIDSLMVDATTVVSIMAQFDQLLAKKSTVTGLHSVNSKQTLIDLYNTAQNILSRNEARLARWKTNICEVPLSSWLLLHRDVATDPISRLFWSGMNEKGVRSCFDTFLTFRTMMDYNSITLYWTIIMSLRLLRIDMLTLMITRNPGGMPANARQMIEDHRIQLMKYALNVLQTICYATLVESRAVAPFSVTTAFQLTVAVLERECESLQAAGGNEGGIRKCESLKRLAVRYLDWATRNTIPVKIDLDSLSKRDFVATTQRNNDL